MSGLAVFGFKMPSLLQFEKDKASEPWIRRNSRTLYGVGTQHEFHAYTDVPLNDVNHNYRVNVLGYWETKKDGRKQHFSWVTKLPLTSDKLASLVYVYR